ncbi:MAG TPA: aldolase/citrate lyase family protein [Gemmatimonadaceae bacterium]|jgi:4-hydroxy-2-oxoheptanedioate aldolase|nr:aldolase/citrate lyase family protein [Gemmatimonadaceae bacterium]
MTIDGAFRARLLAGEYLTGFWLNLGSPLTAEMAGLAGFDWVLLDHEHGAGSEETMLHQLQAVAATPATCLVRIAANEAPRFKRALDAGAAGVMVPYVSTPDEARAAVNAMRYPPRGMRGVAKLTRASAFGANFDAYFANAHEWLVTLTQIETVEAVANAPAIAAVDGVDVLFVGPMDLTTSMGIPGQYGDQRFHDALDRVAKAAKGAGKAVGILLLDPANLGLCQELGYTVVALGSDGGAVAEGLKRSLTTLETR